MITYPIIFFSRSDEVILLRKDFEGLPNFPVGEDGGDLLWDDSPSYVVADNGSIAISLIGRYEKIEGGFAAIVLVSESAKQELGLNGIKYLTIDKLLSASGFGNNTVNILPSELYFGMAGIQDEEDSGIGNIESDGLKRQSYHLQQFFNQTESSIVSKGLSRFAIYVRNKQEESKQEITTNGNYKLYYIILTPENEIVSQETNFSGTIVNYLANKDNAEFEENINQNINSSGNYYREYISAMAENMSSLNIDGKGHYYPRILFTYSKAEVNQTISSEGEYDIRVYQQILKEIISQNTNFSGNSYLSINSLSFNDQNILSVIASGLYNTALIYQNDKANNNLNLSGSYYPKLNIFLSEDILDLNVIFNGVAYDFINRYLNREELENKLTFNGNVYNKINQNKFNNKALLEISLNGDYRVEIYELEDTLNYIVRFSGNCEYYQNFFVSLWSHKISWHPLNINDRFITYSYWGL